MHGLLFDAANGELCDSNLQGDMVYFVYYSVTQWLPRPLSHDYDRYW